MSAQCHRCVDPGDSTPCVRRLDFGTRNVLTEEETVKKLKIWLVKGFKCSCKAEHMSNLLGMKPRLLRPDSVTTGDVDAAMASGRLTADELRDVM